MPFEDVLVSVRHHETGKRVGAGFLVGEDLVLTCAHVANSALGRSAGQLGPPQHPVSVSLHTQPLDVLAASVAGGPDAWSDPPASARLGADLCLLQLPNRSRGTQARLAVPDRLIMRPFRAAGFPQDWNGDLDIASGEIVGRDEYGLYLLRPNSASLSAYTAGKSQPWTRERRTAGLAYSGFSGGPVEVDDRIVGIITEARAVPSQVTAYMIPVTSFPDRISTPILNLRCTEGAESTFISRLARGPMVKETYLVTSTIVEAYARLAGTHVEAHTIIATANRHRVDADASEDRSEVKLIQTYMLPNFDKGAYTFWHDCLIRACTMGPRMLAAILTAVSDETFEDDAKRDRRNLLRLLLSRYKDDQAESQISI